MGAGTAAVLEQCGLKICWGAGIMNCNLAGHPQDKGPHAPHGGLDALRKTAKRLTTPSRNTWPTVRHCSRTFAQRFETVHALCVRADGGKLRFSRHMGHRERESGREDRTPDRALRG